MKQPKVLVITPVKHIDGLSEKIAGFSNATFLPEASMPEILSLVPDYEAVYTNPNKSNVFLGQEVIDKAEKLKVICTASTGTNHIDKSYAAKKGVAVLSLTEERETINKISSTAEHAFALTLSALRNIPASWQSVKDGGWDYEPFIGRQLNHLVVGVIGFGRLGGYYSKYAKAFGSDVLVYDPYKTVEMDGVKQVEDINMLLKTSDIISIHVHVTEETLGMIDKSWFSKMKSDVLLVNSARGDIVNEDDLIEFLKEHPKACYATDVIANEVSAKQNNPLIDYAVQSGRVLITPHIGGMTREGQMIAYHRAADMLNSYFNNNN